MRGVRCLNQISGENGKRRVVITGNVRGRDLGAFAGELRERVGDEIELPEGTWIEYGATFEQLIPAGKRLSVIVPVVLVMIFVLLFMAFGSGKDAAIEFSGVPLTLTGGVLALWLRGIPFLISAGAGFSEELHTTLHWRKDSFTGHGQAIPRAIRPMREMIIMNAPPFIARGAAIAIAIAGVTGLAFWAHDSAASQNLVAGPMQNPAGQSAEHSADYIAQMSAHVEAESGASAVQKAQIDTLFDQARRDLASLDAQMQKNSKLSLAILSKDRVDGAELEDVRQDRMRLADQVSQRMTQLVADIAGVLTPAQRKALAARAHGN